MDQTIEFAVLAGLALWCMLAVLMSAFKLPGTWLILAGALGYGWWADWIGTPVWLFAGLVGVAILAEIVETFASVLTAKKAGASTRAAWGGFIGAFLGMIFLTFLLPIPLVGSVFGAMVGCFAGALIGELTVHDRVGQGAKVGFFATLGFVFGIVVKMSLASVMAAALLTSVYLSLDDLQQAGQDSTTTAAISDPSTGTPGPSEAPTTSSEDPDTDAQPPDSSGTKEPG
ncbi:MAG: DUF456 domain-containing protein [Planctomycetota bacterium]